MGTTKHIVIPNEGTVIRVPSGEHYAEPLFVEAGELSVRFELAEGARLHISAFVFAPDNHARLSLDVDLSGKYAEVYLHGLYIAAGVGHAGIDVTVRHSVSDCTSRQQIKGIAADEATGSFSGLVYVARDAVRTDATQQSRNLQLTDAAHIFTRPWLEIYADDVMCTHGASIGRLDEEAIYYMRQRGVGEREAKRMLMQGFVDDIVNHCPPGDLKDRIGAKAAALIERF